MIKAIYIIALLLIYRKYDLLWSYSTILRKYFKKARTTYAIYALYKSGFIELDEAASCANKKIPTNRSLKMRILSMYSPDRYISKLNKNDRLLIDNNWEGINCYLENYSLLPFVDDIPWKTFPVSESASIDSPEKVSIIMTVRNSVHTLAYSINSILAQSYSNLELIIVDDFSTDGSTLVLQKIAELNDRVKLIIADKNNGTYTSRNIALKYVTGDYVTIHDADDMMHPQHIEIMLKELKKKPRRKASISYWIKLNKEGVVSTKRGFPLLRLNLSSLMIKREVLNDIPKWDEYLCGSDLYFYYECIELYGRESIAVIKKPLSLSLISDYSLTGSSKTGIFSKDGRKLRSQYENWWRRVLLKKYHPVTYSVMEYCERSVGISGSNRRYLEDLL